VSIFIQQNTSHAGTLAAPGGTASLAFTSNITAGDSIVVFCWQNGSTAASTDVTVTDTLGNTYTIETFGVPPGAASAIYAFVAIGSPGGANTVTITTGSTAGNNNFWDFLIAEYPKAASVRNANSTVRFGGGTVQPSTTLTGTVAGDYCVSEMMSGNGTGAAVLGAFGANAASLVHADSDNWTVQEGLSDGSSPMTVTQGSINDWFVVSAVALVPLAPTITSQPANVTTVIGSTATFSVTATSSGGSLSYQWKKNGTNIGGATSSSFTTGTLTINDDNSSYTVVVTDSNGSTTSSAAILRTFWNLSGAISVAAIGQAAVDEIPSSTPSVFTDALFFGSD
jgi:hypothetical protein